jgi:N-acetylglutamate synthase-like GNAT family acetyltransferase
MTIEIREARIQDVAAIEAIIAPEVERGALLARAVRPDEFLVAAEGERVVGCVGLKTLADGVAEVGTLVALHRGRGIGSRLVDAALAHAADMGATAVVALTAETDFFERAGFRAVSDTPWIRAMHAQRMPAPVPLPARHDLGLDAATDARAARCAACPRLGACGQAYMVRPVAVRRARRARR